MLECPKCLMKFAAAGNIDQSKGGWSYRTAGPFSVADYAEGAYAVLLTLDALSHRMLSTLRTTSVPSFTAKSADGKMLEADFAMFWSEMLYGESDTGLLFGECKTYGTFEKDDFDRMRNLASTFPGAILVFSTLRKTLTKKEVSAIKRLAKFGRKPLKTDHPINPVLILTGTEILHQLRPPYCWDEVQQQKFKHNPGILGLCDATQQIYLGLPPVQQEWREKMERRRAQLNARNPLSGAA